MQLSLQQKKALYWGLGILTAMVLMNVAWAEIHLALARCFSSF